MNEIVFAFVVLRHCRERLPIDSFFVNAQSTPFILVLKNLMCQLIDAGRCLAGASVAGDEPAARELISFPSQPAKLGDMALAQQNPRGDDEKQNGIAKPKSAQRFGHCRKMNRGEWDE